MAENDLFDICLYYSSHTPLETCFYCGDTPHVYDFDCPCGVCYRMTWEQMEADKDVNEITLTDRFVMMLYAQWSEDTFRASWMYTGDSDIISRLFTPEWIAKEIMRDVEDYEKSALPMLRAKWREAVRIMGDRSATSTRQ